jgi:hypothetical protein
MTGRLELAVEMLPVYSKVRLGREIAILVDAHVIDGTSARLIARMIDRETQNAAADRRTG